MEKVHRKFQVIRIVWTWNITSTIIKSRLKKNSINNWNSGNCFEGYIFEVIRIKNKQ